METINHNSVLECTFIFCLCILIELWNQAKQSLKISNRITNNSYKLSIQTSTHVGSKLSRVERKTEARYLPNARPSRRIKRVQLLGIDRGELSFNLWLVTGTRLSTEANQPSPVPPTPRFYVRPHQKMPIVPSIPRCNIQDFDQQSKILPK